MECLQRNDCGGCNFDGMCSYNQDTNSCNSNEMNLGPLNLLEECNYPELSCEVQQDHQLAIS